MVGHTKGSNPRQESTGVLGSWSLLCSALSVAPLNVRRGKLRHGGVWWEGTRVLPVTHYSLCALVQELGPTQLWSVVQLTEGNSLSFAKLCSGGGACRPSPHAPVNTCCSASTARRWRSSTTAPAGSPSAAAAAPAARPPSSSSWCSSLRSSLQRQLHACVYTAHKVAAVQRLALTAKEGLTCMCSQGTLNLYEGSGKPQHAIKSSTSCLLKSPRSRPCTCTHT